MREVASVTLHLQERQTGNRERPLHFQERQIGNRERSCDVLCCAVQCWFVLCRAVHTLTTGICKHLNPRRNRCAIDAWSFPKHQFIKLPLFVMREKTQHFVWQTMQKSVRAREVAHPILPGKWLIACSKGTVSLPLPLTDPRLTSD